jgi:hypothetical protein
LATIQPRSHLEHSVSSQCAVILNRSEGSAVVFGSSTWRNFRIGDHPPGISIPAHMRAPSMRCHPESL